MKEKPILRLLMPAVAVGLTALLLWASHTSVLDVCAAAVVFSAKTLLPLQLPVEEVTGIAALPAAAAVTTAAPETTIPPQTTVPTTAAVPETTATTVPALQSDAFLATPQDILARMKAAKQAAKTEKKGGTLLEKQYTTEGVTDQKGMVRVKNTNDTEIDLAALLKRKADLSVTKDAPSVLIFHTHTTETYQLLDRPFYAQSFASRSSDKGQNMVRVGDEICKQLEEAGFFVLHDTEIHDARYTGAYEKSRATVKDYLKKYPSIQITLDIHRDAILPNKSTKIKPTAVIGGKKAAQVMIISGCQEAGNGVTDFPDWEQNLIFALQLQRQMETTFPGLTRPLFFCARRYNMHLTHCSLLIEVGSDGNTLEEAAYSGRCVGKALADLMAKYERR